jgi:hypothetical protein
MVDLCIHCLSGFLYPEDWSSYAQKTLKIISSFIKTLQDW